MDITMLLLAGSVAGVAAGMLGIGGGVIIVPVLSLVFASQQVDPSILIKVAVGTSLATIVVTSISSIWAHHKKGAVRWSLVKIMSSGVVVGALTGSWLADLISSIWLTWIFVFFLTGVSLQMAIGPVGAGRELPGNWGLRGFSVFVGNISAMMGVGGGSLHVPFMSWCGIPVKQAIATSAAIGLPLAIASTLGFVITGLDETHLPPHSIGYINLPAFAGVVTASILFAPLGARLAHRLPDKWLKRVFSLFLFVLALQMIYQLLI